MNDLAFIKNPKANSKNPSQTKEKPMNYAQEQRMHLIDFLLRHYGFLQREQIIDFFAISQATATRDLAAYSEMRPGNMAHNPVSRRWERTMSFRQLYASYDNAAQEGNAKAELATAQQ